MSLSKFKSLLEKGMLIRMARGIVLLSANNPQFHIAALSTAPVSEVLRDGAPRC